DDRHRVVDVATLHLRLNVDGLNTVGRAWRLRRISHLASFLFESRRSSTIRNAHPDGLDARAEGGVASARLDGPGPPSDEGARGGFERKSHRPEPDLDIKKPHVLGVADDERPPRLDVLTHQH